MIEKRTDSFSKYCECDKAALGHKCNFCTKYQRLRSYISLKNRTEAKGGHLTNAMNFNIGALKQWFKNTVGRDYNDKGKRPTTYNTKKRQAGTAEDLIKEFHNETNAKHIIGSPISPDTFEFKDNRIFIKDSRDIKIIEINLSLRTISILQDSKYKAQILSNTFGFNELIKSKEIIIKIKQILEA